MVQFNRPKESAWKNMALNIMLWMGERGKKINDNFSTKLDENVSSPSAFYFWEPRKPI